jgi:hypothetical protein
MKLNLEPWIMGYNFPSRIIYTLSHFPRDENLAKEIGGTMILAIDVPAEGNLTLHFNDFGTSRMALFPSSEDLLASFNDKIPEDIFHPDLGAICRTKFIRRETETIERITLTRFSMDSATPEETVLEWDANRGFRDFPAKLLELMIDFGDLTMPYIEQVGKLNEGN